MCVTYGLAVGHLFFSFFFLFIFIFSFVIKAIFVIL